MKIGISAYSFSKLVKGGGFTLFDAVSRAKEMGYAAIEFTGLVPPQGAVDHHNYGLLVDIGNFMCADESSLSALPAVMPYAFHVHAKDFLWKSGAEGRPDDSWFPTRGGNYLRGTILGHGVIPLAQCLAFIKAAVTQVTSLWNSRAPRKPWTPPAGVMNFPPPAAKRGV
jgi:sugar phosphate isomerase/epimerase